MLAFLTNLGLGVFQVWFMRWPFGWVALTMAVALAVMRAYRHGQKTVLDAMEPDAKIEVMDGVAYVTPKKGDPYMIRIPDELEEPHEIMGYVQAHLR